MTPPRIAPWQALGASRLETAARTVAAHHRYQAGARSTHACPMCTDAGCRQLGWAQELLRRVTRLASAFPASPMDTPAPPMESGEVQG